jgi:regulator of RNase E activity RraA
MTSGYQIHPMPKALPQALQELLQDVSVATIGHLMWDGFMDHRLVRAMQPETRILGTAVTLRLPTPDTALLHYVSGRLRPGDVVVIDRAGDTRLACLGGNVALALSLSGAAGAIVDGPICDPDEIREHGFPIWARGVSPITTRRVDPPMGSLNVPVTCAGVTVNPGDLILADESGVFCIDRDRAMQVAQAAQIKEATSTQRRAQLRGGEKLGALTGADARVAEHLVEGALL